ncbi:hypothetical protein [Geminocystis sp. NIES-3709]|nr:hypothetical protein [Geminocystis sp. NIES-3709]BAQ65370.1 hypothetical protein GM3709_2135 [Geminocystis sp. NIES-3709]
MGSSFLWSSLKSIKAYGRENSPPLILLGNNTEYNDIDTCF